MKKKKKKKKVPFELDGGNEEAEPPTQAPVEEEPAPNEEEKTSEKADEGYLLFILAFLKASIIDKLVLHIQFHLEVARLIGDRRMLFSIKGGLFSTVANCKL